ncbi:MAG: hypothetical protein ACK4UY_09930 [Dietzia sp.]
MTGCSVPSITGTPQQTVVVTEFVSTVTGAPPAQGGVEDQEAGRETIPVAPPAATEAPGDVPIDLDAVIGVASGTAGVAVAAVGGGSDVQSSGSWQTGVAWSTIKVPLAIAATRIDPQSLERASTAITVSDNQAAENLWNSLGGGTAAASAVGVVLTEGGDYISQVPSVRTRVGYSIFGQTLWSLIDQARFGSRLPCLGSAAPVVNLMGQVSPDQSWGLGRIPGSRFKGGWGPGESGGYLVRQFGTVPAAGGELAVAVAVESASFEEGVRALSGVADALALRLPSIQGGRC